MTKFEDILPVINTEKQIQVYGGKRVPVTKTRNDWLSCKDKDIMKAPVFKIKDRPTDIYVYIELGDA